MTERKTILVIDDDAEVLDLISVFLEENGFNVLTSLTVKKGIEFLHGKHNISMILTDLVMPEDDGFSLLSYLNKIEKLVEIPTVVLSALSEQKAVLKAFSLGARDYLTKPFQFDSLITKIKKNLKPVIKDILVVTASNTSVALLNRMLINQKYNIISTDSAYIAFEIARTQPVDVIISELKLTDMPGLKLIKQVKKIKNIPVLLFIDAKSNMSLENVLKEGGDGILERPFNKNDILETISLLEDKLVEEIVVN